MAENLSLFDDEPTVYGPQDKPKGHGPDRGIPKIHDPRDKRDIKERSFHDSPNGAPPLDWWIIGTKDEALERVIRSMCPERVCKVCGEPSRRIVEKSEKYAEARARIGDKNKHRTGVNDVATGNNGDNRAAQLGTMTAAEYVTTGWTDCGHDDWRPGLVLDPFGGSGTTALVATGHGRDCILIDLDERNYELALQRVGPFILERAG